MKSICAVAIDDDKRNITTLRRPFGLGFERFGVGIKWKDDDAYQDSSGARDRIIASPGTIHFAVVDLYFRQTGEEAAGQPEGIEVIKELRSNNPGAYILLVTSYPELDQTFSDKAKLAGADEAISRNLLRGNDNYSFASVAHRVIDKLRDGGILDGWPVEYDESDPEVVSLLESLGRGSADRGVLVIENLCRRFVESRETQSSDAGPINDAILHVNYLAPGRSGAHVCRVDMEVPSLGGTECFLLKVSLDKVKLEQELAANRNAARVMKAHSIAIFSGLVNSEMTGYSALVGQIADGTESLTEWSKRSRTPAEVRNLAKVIFNEYLPPLYSKRVEVEATKWLAVSASHVVAGQGRLKRVRPAIADPRAAHVRDAEHIAKILDGFMLNHALPSSKPLPIGDKVMGCRTFGDLHSGNILVDKGTYPRPILIDASSWEVRHWAADVARLAVDLVLRLWQGGVEAMVWSSFAEWRNAVRMLCPKTVQWERRFGADEPAAALIDELLTNLPEFTKWDSDLRASDAHWQWHVAVGKELLRQGSHEDLTPPKSALAFVGAADHLRLAAIALKRLAEI
jgi:hypothetical protein